MASGSISLESNLPPCRGPNYLFGSPYPETFGLRKIIKKYPTLWLLGKSDFTGPSPGKLGNPKYSIEHIPIGFEVLHFPRILRNVQCSHFCL